MHSTKKGEIIAEVMYRTNAAHQQWLEALLTELGAVAGSVHERRGADLHLTASHNLPAPVIAAVTHVPHGKGMAGLAQVRKEPVQTCNLQTDESGAIKPGAKAVNAQAALAAPVLDEAGDVAAVVGIAWMKEGEIGPEEERSIMLRVASLPPAERP